LLAGYASATVRAGSRLVLTPELRFDSYDVGGTYARDLGPRLGARLKLRDDVTLKAGGGRFTQTPSLPLQIPGVESFGLGLFGLQSSWQASLGVETSRLARFDLSLTGYVQRYVLTDLRDPTPTSPDPLADDFLIRRDAVSYGIELLARGSFHIGCTGGSPTRCRTTCARSAAARSAPRTGISDIS
jgi:outer membrane receptor protein involved in Fe transport